MSNKRRRYNGNNRNKRDSGFNPDFEWLKKKKKKAPSPQLLDFMDQELKCAQG